ncbi:hypothetical protein AX774_g3444 [Zancudomyces culisetae]|uniref:Uncharacterized protein n=1 Tax=Zancudomyces culisetae TaxID=1213189 RepID=A0A1R1PQ57_ZANCU|nr:hypothetical protein AX774_g3444 [Zancudomyces culisetae]|eukprot:OMH83043.1 hypothetical protein AX774_g3444 [Zancudomyces culisetae]
MDTPVIPAIAPFTNFTASFCANVGSGFTTRIIGAPTAPVPETFIFFPFFSLFFCFCFLLFFFGSLK